MHGKRFCIHCGREADWMDPEYDEGYCQKHFDIQQRSSEPIPNPMSLEED